MTLNELTSLVKKFTPLTVGSVIVAALGLFFFYYLDNPSGDQGFGRIEKPKIQKSLSDQIKIQSTAKFNAKETRLADVYQMKSRTLDKEKLLSKFEISGEPLDIHGILIWDSLSKNFSIENSIFNFNDLTQIGPKTISEEQAFDKAEQLIKELEITTGKIDLVVLETKYLIYGFNHQQEVDPSYSFNAYSFNLGLKVGNLFLVDGAGSKIAVSVIVGVDGKIKSFQGPNRSLALQEKSSYPTKRLDLVKKEIKEGKGVVVEFPDFSAITSGVTVLNYTKGELVYYLNSVGQNYLQPVFLLQTSQDSSENSVNTLLPALKNEVYK